MIKALEVPLYPESLYRWGHDRQSNAHKSAKGSLLIPTAEATQTTTTTTANTTPAQGATTKIGLATTTTTATTATTPDAAPTTSVSATTTPATTTIPTTETPTTTVASATTSTIQPTTLGASLTTTRPRPRIAFTERSPMGRCNCRCWVNVVDVGHMAVRPNRGPATSHRLRLGGRGPAGVGEWHTLEMVERSALGVEAMAFVEIFA